MSDLKKKAAELASHGRYGDTHLLHVAPEELAGIAALMPGGKLTTNPKTGLPEAFFFLPFLAGLGGLGTLAGGAATAGALGSGMTAGMTAAALPLTTGAEAAALGAAGTGAAASGTLALPTAAATSTLPATATAALPSAAVPTSLGGVALPSATAGLPSLASSSPFLVEGAMPPASSIGVAGSGTAGTGITAPATGASTASTLGGALPSGAAGVGAMGEAAGTVAVPKSGGFLSGIMNDPMKMMQYGAMMSAMMPKGGGGGKKEKGKKIKNDNYERGPQASPGSDFSGDREFDYFPRSRYFSGGGLVKGYAEGGIASLQPQGSQGGMEDEELIEATMMALMGQVPNGEAIIDQFVATFGQEALQDLIMRLQSQAGQSDQSQPMGDGMSDSVPAMISGPGGQQPAALSEGEYIIPADVVSGLGNGSTQAGARQLEGMVDRTRQMRNGGIVQPPAINPRSVMPV